MTGELGSSVDASELAEPVDLVDFADLMLGNLMLRLGGGEQASSSAVTRACQ